MRILALETTEKAASIAASLDGQLLHTVTLEPQRRSAQTLIPGIRQLLADIGWQAADIELIGLPIGPGSFTGLRVGVTAAKTLAYATGCSVLGLCTLEVIAEQAPGDVPAVWSAMDAQRQQVYGARFERKSAGLLIADAPQIYDNEVWLQSLRAGVMVSGPVISQLQARLPSDVNASPPATWTPNAVTVARMAYTKHQAGQRQDFWQLVPNYYRVSAAEEKWAQRVGRT